MTYTTNTITSSFGEWASTQGKFTHTHTHRRHKGRLPYPKIMFEIDDRDGERYIYFFKSEEEIYVLDHVNRNLGDMVRLRDLEDFHDYEGEIYGHWLSFITFLVHPHRIPWFETPEDTARINKYGISHEESRALDFHIRDMYYNRTKKTRSYAP